MNQLNLQIDQSNPNIHYTTVTATPDGRLTEQDAAKYLGVEVATLEKMRKNQYGPEFTVVCHNVFYYLPALDDFLHYSWRGVNDYHYDAHHNDFGEDQRNFWLAEEFEHHLAHLPEQDDITDDEWLQHYCL